MADLMSYLLTDAQRTVAKHVKEMETTGMTVEESIAHAVADTITALCVNVCECECCNCGTDNPIDSDLTDAWLEVARKLEKQYQPVKA